MKHHLPLALLLLLCSLIAFPLSGCTPSGTPGGGVSAEGYSAPAPTTTVERTENMQSQFREMRR